MLNQRQNKAIFYDSTHYIPDDYSINNLRKTIFNKCTSLCNFLKSNYDVNNGQDLKEIIIKFFQFVIHNYTKHGHSDTLLYELQAIESIIRDPNLINKLYGSIEEKIHNTQNNFIYNSNLLRSQRLVLTEAFQILYGLEYSREHNIPFNNKSIQKLDLEVSKQKSRNNQIICILKQLKSDTELAIRELQVPEIQSLGAIFSILNLLEEYISTYKKNSQKFGFQDLDYTLNENSTEVGLLQVFSEDFLNSLSIQDLSFFFIFWNNRFAKECNTFCSAFLCIDSLNLWDNFFTGDTNFNLSDEKLIAVLRKSAYLRQLVSNTFTMQTNSLLAKEFKEGKPNGHVVKNYTDYYTQLHNFIGKDYQNFFSADLESNDFYEDFCFSKYLNNLEMLAYSKKNNTLQPLIKNLLDTSICKNWGLVRYNYINGNYMDSLDSSSSMLLLAFDIEGFNMPIRFHISKDDLINLVKQHNQNCIIPEYQGNEDFIIDDEFISTPILMPILKKHREIIRNNINSGEHTNFWEHIQFLMNGKFPAHLTNKLEIKNKVIQSRITRKYVSLLTKEEFLEDKNGFRRINNDNIR